MKVLQDRLHKIFKENRNSAFPIDTVAIAEDPVTGKWHVAYGEECGGYVEWHAASDGHNMLLDALKDAERSLDAERRLE